ncbi:MAG: transglycosylase domain-containing protein, partial [Bacteroidota bacterium]
DGQWRFPLSSQVPEKFQVAIIQFEDRRFFTHWGFDSRAILRAVQQNLQSGHIVSGGSTLSMQVIRLSKNNPPRTFWNKFLEIILATRLELRYAKSDILNFYAAHAPFGGNVVGLEAAAWRYFGKKPALLSWSEAATLAVLPNSPALIHPGRNRTALLKKRNRLLDRLLEIQQIDTITHQLAKAEPLPNAPLPLPRLAPHLLDRLQEEPLNLRVRTTLSYQLQQQVDAILTQHQHILSQNYIHNAAALVLDIVTGDVLAYVGNVKNAAQGAQVDIITAPRSTGSILKPLLYANMIQKGELTGQMLLPDIPTQVGGYRPQNFHKKYDGVIRAEKALARSLNVPFVRMLKQHGLENFHHQLQKLHFSTIQEPADHYGLTLILGGAETTLEHITNTYACMARNLLNYASNNGKYNKYDFRSMNYIQDTSSRLVPKQL